jgi:thiamine pyrophosphate-dependent acetolactate synthase large subunit-like protein
MPGSTPDEDAATPSSDARSDQPAGPLDKRIGWGSDVAAQMLRRLGVPYIALNPGASYRGFHDSLVNHLGNERPQMLVCLHEEHAVAIAQGYAKVTGKPMAVALHSNVGLMHGAMAIFNAWCDRQPMIILGATGPVDAATRRPWIDWVHTSQDQGALIRNFVKWDDQPGSVAAIPESMLRAWQQTATPPHGPVYVCLDAGLQEQSLADEPELPEPARFAPAAPARPDAILVAEAARLLAAAKRPLILFGRCRRTIDDWNCRVALAERLDAQMLSDLKAGSMVPTDHRLHVSAPFNKMTGDAKTALRQADVILSLGWIDLGGALRQAFDSDAIAAKIIHVGQDHYLHNGWGKEYAGLPPVDIHLAGDPDAAAADLLAALPNLKPPREADLKSPIPLEAEANGEVINLRHVANALKHAAGDQPVTFACLARAWPADLWPHRHPLDYLGKDGGGGVGSGPGITIGAALALKGSGRLTVGVIGDGDCLMSMNALWTAAKYGIPTLFVVANNRSYFNDELHQESVAKTRRRNIVNRWIGQAIDDPVPDIASIARAQGMEAFGPVTQAGELARALQEAVTIVRSGRPCLVDAHIDPHHGRATAGSTTMRSTPGSAKNPPRS